MKLLVGLPLIGVGFLMNLRHLGVLTEIKHVDRAIALLMSFIGVS